MNDFKKPESSTEIKKETGQETELYRAVEEFLNNFGKENALYPTRSFVQVEAAELQKLARIFYRLP